MFSVRVEPVSSKPGHAMYQADKYMVYHEQDGHAARLSLQSFNDGVEVYTTVTLGDGDVAYVMNDHGVTVDVLRTKASSPKKEKPK